MTIRLADDEIYEAAFDDEALDAVLGRLAESIGARSFVAGWHFNDRTAAIFRHSGYWSEKQLAHYNEHFAFSDVWNVAALTHWQPNRARDMGELVSERAFEGSLLHNEFFRPLGDDTYRAVSLTTESRHGCGAIAFHRGKSQRAFDPEGLRQLEQHAAHLGHILRFRARVAELQRTSSLARSAMDALGQVVILVTGDGRLLYSNAAAEAVLGDGGALLATRGVLTARCPRADKALKRVISEAAEAEAPSPGAVLVPSAAGGSLALSVIGARPEAGTRNVLVTASVPLDQSVEGRLRALYGLTAAEASLALALAEGATPAEAAETRGVALNTVRSQIKTIAAKLGCRRHAEIVRLVRSLPALRGSEGPRPPT